MIIDLFNFSCENDLLEVRLEELKGFVDLHVIVEARRTFSGIDKGFLFDKERFSNYPIHYCQIPDIHGDARDMATAWIREGYYYNYAGKCIPPGDPDDLIIFSGLDEIYEGKHLDELYHAARNSECATICNDMRRYYLNTKKPCDPNTWAGCVAFLRKNMHDSNYFRQKRGTNPIESISGWHFASCGGGVDGLRFMHLASAHVDHVTSYSVTEEALSNQLNNVISLPIIEENLPKYVINNLDKFQHMLK